MGCLLRRGAYRLSYDREVVSSVQTAPVFGGFCGCQTPFSTHSFLLTHRSTGSPPLLATAGFFMSTRYALSGYTGQNTCRNWGSACLPDPSKHKTSTRTETVRVAGMRWILSEQLEVRGILR